MNGYRLCQARELKKWTQAELAERTGVSQATIARIEQGSLRPSSALSDEIANKTGFPKAFFFGTDPAQLPEGSLLLYRKRQALKSGAEAYIYQTAQAAVTMYFHLRRKYRPPSSSIPDLSNENFKDAARAARTALGIRPGVPVERLIHRFESSGIVCVAVPCADVREFDAFSTYVGAMPIMILNSDRAPDRIRLTSAHELDHLLRRRPQMEIKKVETSAFRFAAEFLMPEHAMRQELVPPVTLSRLAELKVRWGVSISSLVRRGRDLGTITENQYRYLNIKLGQFGWRVNEPGSNRLLQERPRALKKMFEEVYGENRKRLADDLGFPVWLIQSILGVHAEKAGLPKKQAANVLSLAARRARPRFSGDPAKEA
jgi:Zn-dependent peptidase ImmA (M78 family)/DNA-binding XRE family transcriptional regulator